MNIRDIISGESDTFEEVAPAEAEGAVIENEFNEASEELLEDNEVIEDAVEQEETFTEDVEQLEEVEEALGEQLEDPNYEGMDEVTAETIGILIRGIKRRTGFDAGDTSLYLAKESYSPNAGNRRHKTEITYERIGDAVRSGYQKVIEVIKRIIDYIKEFWKKHVSTIGRLRKAIDKLKKRVRDTKGTPEDSGELVAASSLQTAIFSDSSSETITASKVKEVGTRHVAAMVNAIEAISSVKTALVTTNKAVDSAIDKLSKNEENLVADIAEITKTELERVKEIYMKLVGRKEDVEFLGSKDKPLVDGHFAIAKSQKDTETEFTTEFEWDRRKTEPSKERYWVPGEKSDLLDILDVADKILESTQKLGKQIEDATKDVNKTITETRNRFNKAINSEAEGAAKARREINKLVRSVRDSVAMIPKVSSKLSRYNVRFARVAVSFTNQSLAKYTED